MSKFDVGDAVRLAGPSGILLQYNLLLGRVGYVSALTPDEAGVDRISVVYGDQQLFTSIEAALFEYAPKP